MDYPHEYKLFVPDTFVTLFPIRTKFWNDAAAGISIGDYACDRFAICSYRRFVESLVFS